MEGREDRPPPTPPREGDWILWDGKRVWSGSASFKKWCELEFAPPYNKKKPLQILERLSVLKVGGDLLSRFYAVPSALTGLTSLFGMGRGGTLLLKPP